MKTKPETLVEEIVDDFNTYLSKGVRIEEIAGGADPNLNIDDLEKVLRVHFVLTETEDDEEDGQIGVIDFVRDLRDEVRRIKTTVTKDTEFFENEVRGRIDWQRTLKQRYSSALPGRGYACSRTRENYNIEENLVLKRLLAVVHETVFEDLKPALENPDEYEWFEPWVAPEDEDKQGISEVVKDVYLDNIYLQRVDADDTEITDRMVESVKNSRSSLYRNAAELLDRYRRLTARDIDADEAAEILRNTFIRPSEDERLFELYWVFRILGECEDARFKLIDEDYEGLVARWEEEEDGHEYRLFHDSVGSMIFSEDASLKDAPDDGYFRRSVHVNDEFSRLRTALFERDERDNSLWGGRPDILVERRDGDGELVELFIGEVKYTRDSGYAAQGLRELLE
ncbi:MAG: hypothetical protein U5J64_04605 [Halobacteriales archaeon]|nr:hypothetical protein [Halobacteriales archaeon]